MILKCSGVNPVEFIVDDEDIPIVELHPWFPKTSFGRTYIFTRWCIGGNTQRILLHRYLTSPGENYVVDHVNGDSLNNSRSNLRICSRAENNRNRKLQSNNSSGFKGVYFDIHRNKWIAFIKVDGNKKFLGRFATPEAASQVYWEAAKHYYGQFARER